MGIKMFATLLATTRDPMKI